MRRRDFLRAALAGTLVAAIGGQARQLGEEARPIDCVCAANRRQFPLGQFVCRACIQDHMAFGRLWIANTTAGPLTLLWRK